MGWEISAGRGSRREGSPQGRTCLGPPKSPASAAHDLRYPLVAHREDSRDVGHRQPVLVRLANRLVAVGPQPLASLLKLGFAPRVLLRECGEAGAGLGCVALGTGDLSIVRAISANRLA